MATSDIEYAKKKAFQNAKKKLPKDTSDYICKITSKIVNEYLEPINKTIIAYKIIEMHKYENRFIIRDRDSTIYAVLELKKQEIGDIEEIEEIDLSLICDDYDNDE